jgi:2-oxoglutarate/2-oxoacid ferredoxin oxidoreductase subunit beta
MKKHPMLKYMKEESPTGQRLPMIMCPGCGAGQVLNYILRAIDRLIQKNGMLQKDFNLISGVGCSARLTSHYLQFDSGWTIHGRPIAIATGVQLANPDLKTIVIAGDGDVAAIGGNHFIHACRRNLDMTIICVNNGVYGMTGGQVSPTTAFDQATSTTPYGNIEEEFDLCELARTAGATYVARWTTAHPHKTINAIAKGLTKKGTAFIDVLSQCPVHLKREPTDMFKEMKQITVPVKKANTPEIDTKISVGEFCNIKKPDWIERYQKIIDHAQNGNN